MTKRPAFQWYPGDAQRDTALRACCLEARGLWREMLDLMHDGEPYGHLTAGGSPITPVNLARMVGVSARRCATLLAELEDHQVFSRTDAGVIFSRRMVKDEYIRTVRANAGKLGGNPALVGRVDNQTANQNPTPAVAVASASAQNSPSSSVGPSFDVSRDELIERLGATDYAAEQVGMFFAGLPDDFQRQKWARSLVTGLQGHGAPAIQPPAMLAGLADFNLADRQHFPYNAAVFRGFVDRSGKPRLERTDRPRSGSTVAQRTLANSIDALKDIA